MKKDIDKKKLLLSTLNLDLSLDSLEYWKNMVSYSWLGAGTPITLNKYTVKIPHGIAELINAGSLRLVKYPDETVDEFAQALDQIRSGLGEQHSLFNKRHPTVQAFYDTPITDYVNDLSSAQEASPFPSRTPTPETPADPINIDKVFSGHPTQLFSNECKNKKLIGGDDNSTFGVIYRATYRNTDVALKALTKYDHKLNKKLSLNEITVLTAISRTEDHSYIIHLYGIFEDVKLSKTSILVLEYCEKGDLFNLIHYGQKLPWNIKKQMARDAVQAVAQVHYLGFIHLDIKPENFLVDKEQRLKLCDFGSSCKADEPPTDTNGSINYMAYELFTNEKPGQDSDIFSLSMTMAVLVVERQLPGSSKDTRYLLVNRPEPRFMDRPNYLKSGRKWPQDINFIIEVIKAAWDNDRTKRPTAKQILKKFDKHMKSAPPPAKAPSLGISS